MTGSFSSSLAGHPGEEGGGRRGGQRIGHHVHADHVLAVERGDHAGHAGADVAAVHPVPLVAETAHQLGPGACGAAHRPARRAQRVRERVTGQGRRDDVEGLPSGGVDQRLDQVQELGDRAREAMRDQQRLRAGLAGLDVQEVDVLAVDLGGELRVLVELRLGGAPVVLRVPVPGELLQVAQRYAAAPSHAGQLAGPAGAGEPAVQVVDVGLGDLDAEGLDAVAHVLLLVNGTVPPGAGQGLLCSRGED